MSEDKPKRGFALLTPEQRKAVSIKGGSHKSDTKGFASRTPEERREAGRLGGLKSRRTRLSTEPTE